MNALNLCKCTEELMPANSYVRNLAKNKTTSLTNARVISIATYMYRLTMLLTYCLKLHSI